MVAHQILKRIRGRAIITTSAKISSKLISVLRGYGYAIPSTPMSPQVIQCYQCRRFGHYSAKCRSTQRRAQCGEKHATGTCSVVKNACQLWGEIIVLHTVVVLLLWKLMRTTLMPLHRRYILQKLGVLLLKRSCAAVVSGFSIPDSSSPAVPVFRQVTSVSLPPTSAPVVSTLASRRLPVSRPKSVVSVSTH